MPVPESLFYPISSQNKSRLAIQSDDSKATGVSNTVEDSKKGWFPIINL